MRLALLGVVCGLLAGCGSPTPVPVAGVVTLDGRPLADVEVQFIPEGAGKPVSAYTAESGSYQLQVPLGAYRVCLNDARLMMPGDADPVDGSPVAGGAPARPRGPRFPTIYSDVTRTPHQNLTVTGPDAGRDFALSSRP